MASPTTPNPTPNLFGKPPTGPVLAGRRESVVVGIALALLVTAVTISTLYSRREGDLDWPNFGIGLVATIILLGVAGAAAALVTDPAQRGVLVGWPAAFGSIAAASMLVVAMNGNGASAWLSGLLIVAISAAGYWFVREAALTLSAVIGLAILYGKFLEFIGVDDWIGDGDDNVLMFFGALILVFTLAVTVASFFTPHRALVGITVGVVTTVLYGVAVAVVSVASFFVGIFGTGLDGSGDGPVSDPLEALHNDVYVLLVFSAILIAVWAWCGYVTGNPGYRLIIIALTVSMLVSSMVVLGDEHPWAWGLVILVAGAAVLGLVAARALGRGPGVPRTGPDAPVGPSGPTSAPPNMPPPPPAPPTTSQTTPPGTPPGWGG